ncbi:MAG: LysR family transcriptional regulator [Polyangia bacterium]
MSLDGLNYQHLYYFWFVAREGSVTAAAKKLHLTQPTISTQLRMLQDSLGEPLLERAGRNVALTEAGRLAFQYADEIFSIGRDLRQTLKERSLRRLRLVAGIADVMPKLTAYQLLLPAYSLGEPVRLVCRQDRQERLIADLALHELDVVLADAPVPTGAKIRAFNHLLGESPIGIFATARLARKVRPGFPRSLDQAPMLMPLEHTMLRRSLDEWLAQREIRPQVAGEFEDSALLKVFASSGIGVFAAPLIVREDLSAKYHCELIGELAGVQERFYAITGDRRIRNPAVAALYQSARQRLGTAPQ